MVKIKLRARFLLGLCLITLLVPAYAYQAGDPPPTLWWKTFGGKSDDWASAVIETRDGGILVAGFTRSFGAGAYDVYLLKLSANGEKEWEKTFGGKSSDWVEAVIETRDGGILVAGVTLSFGAGWRDIYLLKLSANGEKEWEKTFGGKYIDWPHAVIETRDGGILVAGGTHSFGAGLEDIYLIKLAPEAGPAPAPLQISTVPDGFTVLINGYEKGRTGKEPVEIQLSSLEKRPKEYNITLQREGYPELNYTVSLRKGDQKKLSFRVLRLMTANVGTILPQCKDVAYNLCLEWAVAAIQNRLGELQPDIIAMQELLTRRQCEALDWEQESPDHLCSARHRVWWEESPQQIVWLLPGERGDYAWACDDRNGYECIAVKKTLLEGDGKGLDEVVTLPFLDQACDDPGFTLSFATVKLRFLDRPVRIGNIHAQSQTAGCRADVRKPDDCQRCRGAQFEQFGYAYWEGGEARQKYFYILMGDLNVDPFLDNGLPERYDLRRNADLAMWDDLRRTYDMIYGLLPDQEHPKVSTHNLENRAYDHILLHQALLDRAITHGCRVLTGEQEGAERLDAETSFLDHRAVVCDLWFAEEQQEFEDPQVFLAHFIEALRREDRDELIRLSETALTFNNMYDGMSAESDYNGYEDFIGISEDLFTKVDTYTWTLPSKVFFARISSRAMQTWATYMSEVCLPGKEDAVRLWFVYEDKAICERSAHSTGFTFHKKKGTWKFESYKSAGE